MDCDVRENTMVEHVNLHSMTRDHEETVRSFGFILRGQAGVCKFTILKLTRLQ